MRAMIRIRNSRIDKEDVEQIKAMRRKRIEG
jgi:hypothetical protein